MRAFRIYQSQRVFSFSVPSAFMYYKTANHTFDSFLLYNLFSFMVMFYQGRYQISNLFSSTLKMSFSIITHKKSQCFFHPFLNDHNIFLVCLILIKFVRQIMPLLDLVNPIQPLDAMEFCISS